MTRKVNALDAAYDLGSGMPLSQLMKKYRLSWEQLHSLLESLKAIRLFGDDPNGIRDKVVRAIQVIVNKQVRLGLRYYTGKDVPKDYSKAAKWWIKAA